jgi:type IV pilus assembly protein PilY1
MLTLDDSGSMQLQHMPESVFASDTFVTPNRVGGAQVRWDPNDTFMTPYVTGQVPGIFGSTNWVLRALRSPDTNTIFYNPETLYQPWLKSDGVTRFGNSPPATAYKDPLIFTLAAGTFIDLTTTTAVPAFAPATISASAMVNGTKYVIQTLGNTNWNSVGAGSGAFVGQAFTKSGGAGTGTGTLYTTDPAWSNKPWCFAVNANTSNIGYLPADGCAIAHPAFTHDPGVYFRLTKTGSVYNALAVSGNYTAYSINGAATFPKVAARTDCSGAVGPTGCTQAQERQNYANWFTYYRNRNLLARGGLMEAFGVEAAPVAAGGFVIGSTYAITSVGNTPFTAIGASANAVDTVFTATGVGSGTGTARAIAMRLGFGRINLNVGTPKLVDGVLTSVIEDDITKYGGGGVRDFNFARKDQLFKWLLAMPAGGGTDLIGALEANGQYYSRIDTQGPWTDNPAVATNVVANNKTCRRSYTFLTTDGYWAAAGTLAGNADNTGGTTITSSIVPPALLPAYPPYTYTPVAPYMDSWSNTLADTAMKYWVTDLQPATKNLVPPVGNNVSFWQNMTTFTIGLGVRGTLDPTTDLPALTAGTKVWPQAKPGGAAPNIDDLWHAAVNSRGQYFSVKDPQELALAIRTALARATGGTGSTAGVAAASSTLTGNNRKYKLEFDPGSWNGEITSLGPNPVPPNLLNVPLWKASTQMALTPWSARNIVTFDSTPGTWVGTAFNLASIPATGLAAMGTVAATNPSEFINFLRGDHTNEGSNGLGIYRQRINPAGQPFILGDFVNSNPALIWSNFDGVYTDTAWGGSAAYSAFKVTKAARTPVLFAGSNDGMLHAFKDSLGVTPATDGQEVFAYVPRAVYSNLDKLADKNYGTTAALPHQYFVDGPLAEADAYVMAPGASTASWRNYLTGTLGSGGRAVFALDVTDTANLNASSVRWELSSADDPDIGYVLSNVRIGVLPNGRWVAVFGNGYGSTSGNAVLFVVDLEDAASSSASVRASAIHKTVLDSTGSNGLGGVTLIHDVTTGRTSTIYVGDLKGNLWKLDYNPPTGVPVPGSPLFAANGGAAFFTATDSVGVAQPITSSPAVFKGPTSQGYKGYMVVFGTGKLFSTADGSNTSPQSMYSVWDKKAGPTPLTETVSRPMSRTNLVARTLSAFGGTGTAAGTVFYSVTGAAVDYNSAQRGFYIDLNPVITGGRVVYPSQVLGFSTALVSAVAPVQGTPLACDSSFGVGLNLTLPVDTGTDTTSPSFDTNGDGAVNGSDSTASGYGTKADGGDVSVSSQGVNGNPRADTGGGGPVGDCTGDACAKTMCVKSSYCGAKRCLVILENSTGSQMSCPLEFPDGTRIWRRIINNVPIR